MMSFLILLIVAFCLLAITTIASLITACCSTFFKNQDKVFNIAVAIQRWGTLLSIIVLAISVIGILFNR